MILLTSTDKRLLSINIDRIEAVVAEDSDGGTPSTSVRLIRTPEVCGDGIFIWKVNETVSEVHKAIQEARNLRKRGSL